MSTPVPSETYTYVADGGLGPGPIRQRIRLFRHPLLLLGFLVFGLVFGLAESFATYSSYTSHYLGRIVWIGVVWGLSWIVFAGLSICLLLVLMSWLERRRLRRLFPVGSTTEVTIDEAGLRLAGPTGARSVGYEQMTVVKTMETFLVVCLRRPRFRNELIPVGVLPEAAVEQLRTRALFPAPVATIEPQGGEVRELVVPPRWASRLARVHTAWSIRRRRSLVRVGLTSLVILALALLVSPALLVLLPLLWTLALFGAYVPLRRRLQHALPEGSIATIEYLDDRLVSRNAAGAREVRYDDVRTVDVSGDVACVRLSSGQTFLTARSLIPDDVVERLRAGHGAHDRPGD